MQAKLTSDVMSPNDYPDAMPSTPAHLTEEFVARLEKHQRILFKVAYIYCRDCDDRHDLVQKMLIQVWRSYARFDERVQFSTWMYRIAVNVAITHYRSEGRPTRDTVPIEEYGLDIAAADALFAIDNHGEGDNMRALEHRLFGEFWRRDEEIAEVVGISASNVSTRINRLKTKLQAQFHELNTQKEGKPA